MQLPKKITVAIRQIPNSIEAVKQEDGSYKFFWFDGRYLEIILGAFGVPFEIIVPEDNHYGTEGPDGNWTGLLGMVQRGEADIGTGMLTPTYDKLKYFDFSDPYCAGYVTFGMKRPQNLPVANAFLYAFAKTLWLSLIFLIPLFGFIYYFLLDREYNVMSLCLEMIYSFLKQPMGIRMQSLKERFLLGSWLVFALVISFAYTQVLLSQATVPPEGKLFKTFEELLEAVKMKKLKVYLLDGLVSMRLFRNSPQLHIRELFEIISQNQWYMNRSMDLYMKAIDEGHAVIGGNALMTAPFGDSNELFMSEETLLVATVVMVMNKDFCCKRRLNSIFSRLWTTKIMFQFANEEAYLTRLKKRKPPVPIEAVHPIQLGEIFGVFVILLIGYFISLITLFAELIIFGRKFPFPHIF